MANLVEEAKIQINSLLASAQKRACERGELPEADVLSGTVEMPKDTDQRRLCGQPRHDRGESPAHGAAQDSRCARGKPRARWQLVYVCRGGGARFHKLPARLGRGTATCSPPCSARARTTDAADALRGQKVMVEFVSANPTGPMHMGNARGGVLGDTLAEVLSRAGADVWREFYVNDAGNQIEKFATSIDARYASAHPRRRRCRVPRGRLPRR